ncbi:cell wall metabolism sensor histidine kinase WalK [Eggerthella sp. YY7918]|uniref:sensor histidine kinase n=1 Tax=Eggerthella sp. (strain YY7918) TaxID=502558 RepID=UPI00021712FA|nr:HAMP domain-containing sensor histidine kinase [Eggerthella sp. YY7918]BAK45296.1 hypothetical protein EGYY_22070 [Eggerthella sp. YY7918]
MDGVRVGGGAAAGRRGLPLSLIILRYFAYVLAATFAVGLAAYLAFALVLNMGVAYPANEGDKALEETSARLAVLTSDDEAALDAAIPSCYWWTVFSPDGTRLGGDAPDSKVDLSRAAAFDGLAMEYGVLSTARHEPVKLADGTTCVLTYEYLPQFTSKEMRDALPNPQNLVLVTAAILFVAALAGIVTRAARVIARKMRPLTEAAQRIEGHDLDFSVERSGVREIDDVLGAMDEMRASLKESLETQWRSEQERREQVAALAHDLKTPLTVVRGNLDVVLEGELPDEERACAVDAAASAARMGEYVRKLIDVSNGDATAFSPINANVHLFLTRIHPQANMLATAKDLQLAWHEDPKLSETALRLDEALLERAILNVVANAVEHAPNNSTVEVDVQTSNNEELTISVSDTGPGFSPEALRRGCEAFYQGDPARAAQGHSGLGLHVAAEAALRHGGAVELANRTDSPGARVTLRIPKA